MSNRPNIVVLSGRGRHEDPWHDHAATSHALANVLAPVGDVVVRSTLPGTLAFDGVDLLVLNIGCPVRGYVEAQIDGLPDGWERQVDGIVEWARDGGSVLAVHQTALAVPGSEAFGEVLGGRWVEGVSGHPEIGAMRLTLASGTHPVTGSLGGVDAFDERYCGLRVAPTSQVLGWVHDDEGEPHPALWTTQAHGGRTVYSALGHDPRSYESPSHQELLVRAARSLLS